MSEREWNEPTVPMRNLDMDVFGDLFALRFVTEGQVELYIEDDENYFFKTRFSKAWLADLAAVASTGITVADRRWPQETEHE